MKGLGRDAEDIDSMQRDAKNGGLYDEARRLVNCTAKHRLLARVAVEA